MPAAPDDIPSGNDPAQSDAAGSNALPTLPSEVALAALELDEDDYLADLLNTLGEWAGPEDDVVFNNL